MTPLLLARLTYLSVLDRWADATADPERGDGGPISTAVIAAACLAAALVVVGLIAAAVANHAKSIK